ncbi:flagellar export chaperone FliS [Curtobacterium sp. MCBD17_040]|uniref:flagellar export chaperone FliS n=1 Tax=Curtobacterium sp. MCBD17_040 TaxID=2175674 RepID=UPI000DA8C4EF|nr:flagellar export chaperone FliS [Curtobacterium sp. MCBD17_040]WIB65570.1 flagellar export chaperone FliS [Curtobacterium sp. MCBD17_040]
MASPFEKYRENQILSATPSQLVAMLYARLMLDLRIAQKAMETGDDQVANYRLRHAGDCVGMLAGTLDTSKWDGAEQLLALYMYITRALIAATGSRNVEIVAECIGIIEPLQQAWHEADAVLTRQPEWDTPTAAAERAVMAVA